MKKRIVVIGSSNIDFIMKMDRLPQRDESVPNAEFKQTFGGKGANQAVAAARAGGEVYFVNCVGDDPYAEAMVRGYRESGVNADYVFREKGISSGTALVMIGEGGHNYLSVAPGANALLTPDRLDDLRHLIADSAFILMQFEIPSATVLHALEIANELNVPAIWNFAPASEFDTSQLKRVEILVVNEPEAQMVTGIEVTDTDSGTKAAKSILGMGAKKAIVTLGENGSVVAADSAAFHVEAYPVDAVDTTAAGDTYCGCLAVALAEGAELPEAVKFAGAAAALSVQKLGAQPSTPWRNEIEEFLRERGA